MTTPWNAFWSVALPLGRSPAFERLRRVTFLGILSPAYAKVTRGDLAWRRGPAFNDQSRAHHSLRVAYLAAQIAESLQLSNETVKYAAAWGMVHDIATWPLSHTSEAAFAETTQTSSRSLRHMMICGSNRLPTHLSLYAPIKKAGLDHGKLLHLFDSVCEAGDRDYLALHALMHSALNADTIEGMYRSGRTFGIDVLKPQTFISAFSQDLVEGVKLKKEHSRSAFKFWRDKSKIYSEYINAPSVVELESLWSRTIRERFYSLSISESMDLKEEELIEKCCQHLIKGMDVVRYKSPLAYEISATHRTKRSFKSSVPVQKLSEYFVKAAIK